MMSQNSELQRLHSSTVRAELGVHTYILSTLAPIAQVSVQRRLGLSVARSRNQSGALFTTMLPSIFPYKLFIQAYK